MAVSFDFIEYIDSLVSAMFLKGLNVVLIGNLEKLEKFFEYSLFWKLGKAKRVEIFQKKFHWAWFITLQLNLTIIRLLQVSRVVSSY